MWSALLEDTAGTTNTGAGNDWFLWIFIGVIVVAFIVYLFFSGRKNKARQQEYVEQLEAIRPGHKVKTAGGICGIVVEVCDDNTVIIETGSENSGKSYVKMDKELIAQTDLKLAAMQCFFPCLAGNVQFPFLFCGRFGEKRRRSKDESQCVHLLQLVF